MANSDFFSWKYGDLGPSPPPPQIPLYELHGTFVFVAKVQSFSKKRNNGWQPFKITSFSIFYFAFW
jgi:hypothetical protein